MTRLEAFLNRCALRLFNDSPGLASYLDRTEIKGKKMVFVFDELPHNVIVKMPPAFGVTDVKAFKASEHGTIKTVFVATPSDEDMADLSAYPLEDPTDVKVDAEDPDKMPVRVQAAADNKGGSRMPAAPSRV